MHELGIAQNIVDIIGQYVPAAQAQAVKSIKIRIGKLSGVVPDSLEFSYSAIIAGTPLETSHLEIEHVATISECAACNLQFEMEDVAFICPACNGTDLKLISGSEMQVVEIELGDDEE